MAESNRSQQIIIGALSGALFTAIVGVTEAFWLMNTTGAPDMLSPMYASILYGLIGLGIGLGEMRSKYGYLYAHWATSLDTELFNRQYPKTRQWWAET